MTSSNSPPEPGPITRSRPSPGTKAVHGLPVAAALPTRPGGDGHWPYGALLGLGATTGLLLGGIIVQYLSWPWIFYVNAPIAIAIGVGTLLVVPDTREGSRARVDVLGATLVTAASLLLVHTTIRVNDLGITDPVTLIGFVATAGLLAIFVIQQRRSTNPLVPRQVAGSRTLHIADVCVVAVAAAMFGGFFMGGGRPGRHQS